MSWLFAQVYERISGWESAELRRARGTLIEGLSGEILEVGAGNGRNLALYPAGAHVTATDYSPHMLRKAERRAHEAAATVALRRADVQALPFQANQFANAVAGLVFCSVDDPGRGLRELARVTRPGGQVRLLEHVGAGPGRTRRVQSGLTPLWRRIGDGCHLDRDTVAAVGAAGLVVEEVIPVAGVPRLFPMRLIFAGSPREGAGRSED